MRPLTSLAMMRLLTTLATVVVIQSIALPANAVGNETSDGWPPEARVVAIAAEPTEIALSQQLDYVQLLLTATLDNGETVDVTGVATITPDAPFVAVSPLGVVTPIQDGQTSIHCRFGKATIAIPATVRNANAPLHVDYVHDVMPVISKMGCTAGTCHGAKDGKNGFKLSLRGYDPIADTRAFADDLGARRINRASPEQSLMLLKATASVPHAGGQLTKVGSPYYEIIRTWIADGVPLDLSTPRVVRIQLAPTNPVIARENMVQQMRVIATYADGEVRDVTHEAFVSSGDGDIADIDDQGRAHSKRRGEAPILARFEGAYTATTMTVMGDRTDFVWQQPPTNNFIDELVYRKLQRMKTLPSDLCSDDEFVRRVHLDLTGLPPTVNDLMAFANDSRETWHKRNELIDRLVGSPAYVDHWTNKWADLLQVNRKFLGTEGAIAFRQWIHDHVSDNTPYDEFAYSVLTANGTNRENPAASYYKILREPAAIMENTTHLFLATRFNCNKCHDHPFERWTQDQYYELTAFFARVGLKKDPDGGDRRIAGTAVEQAKPLYEVVYEKETGEVLHDRTQAETPPRFPYQNDLVSNDTASRRERLARWITSADNLYFAKSYVNRIWGYLLGRGLIEPIDDIRAGNPPTNPALLDRLTHRFIESDFDTQALIRTICRSRTYQHSIRVNPWNVDDTLNFSHAIPRRLPAEVLYDAIQQVTGATSKIPGVAAGTRAAQLPDVGVKIPGGFLDQFGRPARESSCECERTNEVMLGPIMALVNGPTISDALIDSQNALAEMVGSTPDDERLVQDLFLRILNRPATKVEIQAGIRAIADAVEDERRLQLDLEQKRALLDDYKKNLPSKIAAWAVTQLPTKWHILDLREFSNTMGAALTPLDDGSWLVTGNTSKGKYEFKAQTLLRDISGFRIEVLSDQRLPKKGPGRADDGNFVLTEFSVRALSSGDEAVDVGLHHAQATHSQNSFPVDAAIDGEINDRGWAVAPKLGQNHTAIFETKSDIASSADASDSAPSDGDPSDGAPSNGVPSNGDPSDADGGTLLRFTLDQNYNSTKHSLGRFRIAATNSPRPLRLAEPPEELLVAIRTPADDRTEAHKTTIFKYYRKSDTELQNLESQVADAKARIGNNRLLGAQDIAWALINSPAFLFNR